MQTTQNFVRQYFDTNQEYLHNQYPGIQFNRFLSEFCEFENVHAEDYFSMASIDFFSLVEEGHPLEYIQKNSYFYRSRFYVDERVLIPRSETEILVEDSVNWINNQSADGLKIAEVGVGSFALGLSILMDSKKMLEFWGGDICEKALSVSKLNLFRHRNLIDSKHKVQLENSDRLEKALGQYDMIVSNPPYIKEKADRDGVHEQAHNFEPHLALYLPDGEFDKWFEDFFSDASNKLNSNGVFFMEGHEDSLLQLKEIALKYFKNVSVKNDYTGRLRFLHAFK